MARKQSAKGGKRGGLDYTYGEETSVSVTPPPVDSHLQDDDLLVGSRTSTLTNKAKDEDLIERVRQREARRMANSKYLGYNEFSGVGSVNAGRGTPSSEDNVLVASTSAKAWNMFIGYILIRIISPFLLIGHCLYTGYFLWFVYHFNFGHPDLQQQFVMPIVVGVLCLHSVGVHLLNKIIFKSNYYKKRDRPGVSQS